MKCKSRRLTTIGIASYIFFFLMGNCLARQLPRVFCLNAQGLAEAKARLTAGDSNTVLSFEYLRQQADEALRLPPLSVMNKPLVPPSGDKHDYMTRGIYWWPDPDKPGGLPYIRKDGQINPSSRSDTDRLPSDTMQFAVETLALYYYFSGEEKYAEHAVMLLKAWFINPATRMNPHLEYAAGIPGLAGQSTGRNFGIIETYTLPRVIDSIGLLQGSKSWTAEDQQAMVKWIDEFLIWLLNSGFGKTEAGQENNHGTWYDVQIVSYALFTGQKDMAKAMLESVKTKRIDRMIEADGRQPEEMSRTKSFHYPMYHLEALFSLAAMGQCAGVDLYHYQTPGGGSLRAALDFIAPYIDAQKK